MGDYEMMMNEHEDIMDRVWLADRDRAIADTINEYEEFDGENRMDQPGFWYGQPDVNDEECE